ncbi:MAG TPA: AI-2E family transporter [Burkholderiaceae bacterium]
MSESTDPAASLERDAQADRVLLHMPVDVRSASLVVIATLLGLFALHWASPVFIPLMLGLLLSYALTPLVDLLARWKVSRPIGAAIVMVTLVGGLGSGAFALRDEASGLIDSLPAAASKLRQALRDLKQRPVSSIDQVQKAATQIEHAATDQAAPASAPPKGVTRVQIEKPAFNIRDYMVVSTMRLFAWIGQFTFVCFVTYFLLAAGDTFRRKLARIAGPTFSKRRITVQALHEIAEQIQRYLVTQLGISVLVGVATALAFWAIGLNNVAIWGIAAAVLNLVPYVGSIVVCVVSALAGFIQFGSIEKGLLVGGVSIVLHVLSGYVLAPWLTSRTSRLNAVAVFVGVLAWGWLWGVWGLLLGTPILMIVKAVCDRVDDLKPVGELLGGDDPVNEETAPATG